MVRAPEVAALHKSKQRKAAMNKFVARSAGYGRARHPLNQHKQQHCTRGAESAMVFETGEDRMFHKFLLLLRPHTGNSLLPASCSAGDSLEDGSPLLAAL